MQGSELTGLPSIDKPWLKYYKPDAEARALDTPNDKSIYRYYMENVFTNPEFPVLKYFNATFSTQQFVDLIPERKIFHHPVFKGAVVVPAAGSECEKRGAFGTGGIKIRQAVKLAVDCLVRGECLGQILLRRQVLHDLNSSFSLLSRVRPS